MKDFGTSKSPKSTRLRDSRYALTVLRPSRFRIAHAQQAARALLHHDAHNDSTAYRMRSLYALHRSLSVAIPAIQPRLRLSGTNRLRFALHGGQRVKAYVRRTKTDAADADALVLADRDDSLHPIPIKLEELQALQGLHRIREQWKQSRVARICEARALLAEFGISASLGARGIGKKLTLATEQAPILLQPALLDLIQEIGDLEQRLKRVDHTLAAYADTNSDVQALLGIQGIGVTIATAFVARVPSIHMFKRGRSFASWLGLTCREYSSGQTRRLSGITKQGDRYLRMMLIHGARAALMAARRKVANGRRLTQLETWAVNTQARVGHNKATVALANKLARIMWEVWTRHELFNGDNALRFAA